MAVSESVMLPAEKAPPDDLVQHLAILWRQSALLRGTHVVAFLRQVAHSRRKGGLPEARLLARLLPTHFQAVPKLR
jgi:hypothetical protein